MATIASMVSEQHGIGEATNGSDRDTTLEVQFAYRIKHLGVAADGTTAATGSIVFTTSETTTAAAVTATAAAATNKFFLQSGDFFYIGPGKALMTYKSMSGDPCFSIERGPHYLGQF